MQLAKLLLADDHTILLDGIRKLLEPEFQIVGSAVDGRELVGSALDLKPDVVLLDIGMPLLNGMEAARQIKQHVPETKIVFLTQQSHKSYVQEALRVGAVGYVLKQSASGELVTAIREVLAGRLYVSPLIAGDEIAVQVNSQQGNPADLFGRSLTPRQREVLQLVAEGKAAKEIAGIVGISVKTVEFHKAAIMEELGLRTTAELTRYALINGIVS